MSAPKFLIVAVLLQKTAGMSFALTTSYRVVGTEDEALGAAIKWAMQANPGHVVAGHLITEVSAAEILMAGQQLTAAPHPNTKEST